MATKSVIGGFQASLRGIAVNSIYSQCSCNRKRLSPRCIDLEGQSWNSGVWSVSQFSKGSPLSGHQRIRTRTGKQDEPFGVGLPIPGIPPGFRVVNRRETSMYRIPFWHENSCPYSCCSHESLAQSQNLLQISVQVTLQRCLGKRRELP